eukprot:CAMPEP_0178567000 /NCGR_PEP_ID=MMETSP0697-20121206/15084_1 /TAXON_ID=265572 /ORGANISM="Extubocellulus spinifer, Strain CCMP396" /LENGTH=938 /DNA_ID=CAMNT_0020200889 /DNA_START=338 /DNA_END=3152 /DNA_ORIENTATION=-
MSRATSSNPEDPKHPQDGRQRYEQLGAPVLLYRHLPSYSTDNTNEYSINPGPWDANTSSKTKPADRRVRVEIEQEKIAMRAEEICSRDLQRMNRSKMRQHGGLPMQLAKRYEYDTRTSTSTNSTGRDSAGGTYPPPPVDHVSRRRRRHEALPEYCAPFGSSLIAWGLTDELDRGNVLGCNATVASSGGAADNGRVGGNKRRYKYYGLAKDEADEELTVPSVCRDVPPSPADYGNCLVVLPCLCRSSRSGRRSKCCWFVVHPTGERLDVVSVSRILLPRQNVVDKLGHNNDGSSKVSLGERLMQISICGANKRWDCNDNGRRILIVRTRSRCIVISSTWINSPTGIQAGDGQTGDQNCCSGGNYTLKMVSEVEFFPQSRHESQSLLPMHVAPNPNTVGTNACAHTKFAVLSHSKPSSMIKKGLLSTSATPQQNAVHYTIVQLDNDCSMTSPVPTVKEHVIPSLRHISQIEFTHHHPMLLWASARSSIVHKPAVHHKVITSAHKRPLSGRGSSLYTIDLRTNEPALVFNPSHGERMVDGLHSVSAILPDCTQMHKIFIQSVSAGSKVWEIDGRMPGRSVCSWTLPGLCDDWGFTGQHGGLHGWGSILAQPAVTKTGEKHLPLLGFGNKGFALSSCFTLPDVSDRIYNYGLAAFRTDITPLLSKEDVRDVFDGEMGEEVDALCVVSMTSRGDMYGHALARHRLAQPKARSFSGLRTGCCAVPIPRALVSSDKDNLMHSDIVWRLQNVFPTPSRAIIPRLIKSRDEVRPFYSFGRRRIPSNVDGRRPPRRRLASSKTMAKSTQGSATPANNEAKEILPPTVSEFGGFKNGNKPNGITSNIIRYCRDKGGTINNSTGHPVCAHSKKQQIAVSDQGHSSIVLDQEKTCDVISKKCRTLERDDEKNNGDDTEADLLPSTLHKLQKRWGTNTNGSGIALERPGRKY